MIRSGGGGRPELLDEEFDHSAHRCLVTLLGEHAVIPLVGAGELHSDERVPEQRAERIEAGPDELVVSETQAEHLTTVGGALGDGVGIIR